MSTIDRIMALMKERGINGAELSRACDLGNAKYYQWKSGKQEPSAKSLLKVAAYLETTVEYLTGQQDQKEKPTPVSESGQIPNYDQLTDENRAMIDGLIAKLLASQSDGQQ